MNMNEDDTNNENDLQYCKEYKEKCVQKISQPLSKGNCESLEKICNYQKDMKKELNQLIKNKLGGKSRKKRMRFGRRKKVTKKRMTSNRKKNKKIRK